MSKHKVSGTSQAVPFSWEHLPGISKVSPRTDENPKPVLVPRPSKLRPPPVSSLHVDPESRAPGFYIPLPPCRLQPNQTQMRKGVKQPVEDPFLAAFIECTKPVKEEERPLKSEKTAVMVKSWPRIDWLRHRLSCKSSCSVKEGNLIKLSKLPDPELEREFKLEL